MHVRFSSAALGALLVIAASALYGAVGIVVPLAVATGFALPLFLAARYLISAGAVHALAAARGEYRAKVFGRSHLAAFGVGLAAIVQTGLFYLALARVDVAMVLALHFTFPAVVLVAESVRARRMPGRRQLVSVGLALTGVGLVVLGGGTQGADPLGLIFAAGSGTTYAVLVMAWARVLRRLTPAAATAFQSTGLGLAWLAACLVLGTQVEVPRVDGLLWLGVIAIVFTVLPMILLAAGTARVGSVTSSTLATTEPVVGAVLAAVIFQQVPSVVTVLGALLIIGASGVVVVPMPDRSVILVQVHQAVRPLTRIARIPATGVLSLDARPGVRLPSSRPLDRRPRPTRPGERRRLASARVPARSR